MGSSEKRAALFVRSTLAFPCREGLHPNPSIGRPRAPERRRIGWPPSPPPPPPRLATRGHAFGRCHQAAASRAAWPRSRPRNTPTPHPHADARATTTTTAHRAHAPARRARVWLAVGHAKRGGAAGAGGFGWRARGKACARGRRASCLVGVGRMVYGCRTSTSHCRLYRQRQGVASGGCSPSCARVTR